MKRFSCLRRAAALVFVLPFFAACSPATTAPSLAPVAELRPGILQGYLSPQAVPNSLALVSPPPTQGSAAEALDRAINEQVLTLRESPRWQQARRDAELRFPAAADVFSCALDLPINTEQTPLLYRLLRRSLTDAGFATYAAKNHYQRQRPFMVNGQASCTPEQENYLRKDGSFPSGHAALGWAWALILAELAPERQDAILARGRAFGQSRVVCNVHWQSDVLEGRAVGAAAVAALHNNPEFTQALAAARKELVALRSAGAVSANDCAAEAAALSALPQAMPWPANR